MKIDSFLSSISNDLSEVEDYLSELSQKKNSNNKIRPDVGYRIMVLGKKISNFINKH